MQGQIITPSTETSYTFQNLQPLVEYTFNISIVANLGNTLDTGPPSIPITFVTLSANCKHKPLMLFGLLFTSPFLSLSMQCTHHISATDFALPRITELTPGTDRVVVHYSVHPNISELTTDLRLQFRRVALSGQTVVQGLTATTDGEFTVTGLSGNTEYEFRLLSRVGSFEYASNQEIITLPGTKQSALCTYSW